MMGKSVMNLSVKVHNIMDSFECVLVCLKVDATVSVLSHH